MAEQDTLVIITVNDGGVFVWVLLLFFVFCCFLLFCLFFVFVVFFFSGFVVVGVFCCCFGVCGGWGVGGFVVFLGGGVWFLFRLTNGVANEHVACLFLHIEL